MKFLDLPNELLFSVEDFLPIHDLYRLSLTCRRMMFLVIPLLYNRLLQGQVGQSPLQWAASYGHLPLAELAILKGDKIDEPTVGDWTPLHLAARSDHPAVIRTLVSYGASIAIKGPQSETPLHTAARYGSVEAARVLLELGADMACRDWDGETPVHLAALEGDIECMRLFVNAGFDINTRGWQHQTIIHRTIAGSNHRVLEMMEYLLGIGRGELDIEARDVNGLTPLQSAVDLRDQWYMVEMGSDMIRLLVRHGAVEPCPETKDNQEHKPLHGTGWNVPLCVVY